MSEYPSTDEALSTPVGPEPGPPASVEPSPPAHVAAEPTAGPALPNGLAAPGTESGGPTTELLEPAPGIPLQPVEPGRPTPVSPPSRGVAVRLVGYLLAAAAGAAVLFAGLAATGSVVTPRPSPSPSPSPSPPYMEGNALGDPGAPVTIEIWADYQCPYCGLLSKVVEPSLERAFATTGKARLVYRDFAFLGQESIDAAVAARCAGKQGDFWYFHDLLFGTQQGENQGAFARARLLSLATFANLDQAAFTACLGDTTVLDAVKSETTAGQRLGVSSTPTIRVIGPGGSEMLTGVKPLSEISAAVARVSQPAASTTPSPGASPTGSSPAAASPATPSPTRASPSP